MSFTQGCLRKRERVNPSNFNPVGVQNFVYSKMQTDKDCGPIAEYQVLNYLGKNISYEEIKDRMGWHQSIGNITDTPLQHKKLLDSLSIPYKFSYTVSYQDIIERLSISIPTIILVNTGLFKYHWIVITGYQNGDWLTSYGTFDRAYLIKSAEFSKIYNGTGIIYYGMSK